MNEYSATITLKCPKCGRTTSIEPEHISHLAEFKNAGHGYVRGSVLTCACGANI